MKILHVTVGIGNGGIATFIEELLSELSKENKVTLVCLEKNLEKYREEKLKNVNVIFFNQSNMYSLKNIFKLRKIIKVNDIIHSHLFPTQYIVVIASLFLNKNLVTTEHSSMNNRRKYKIFRYIDKFFYNKYRKIITVSKIVKINLVSWIGMNNKIEIIYNGIDLEKYKNGKNIRKEINKLCDFKDTDKLICMIARFIPPKDHKTVINAIKLLPENIKCIFVGIGQQLLEVQTYVKEYNLENRIKFLGYRENIQDILNSCDISVLSSGYEGLSFVVLESLASNLLFLGSNVNGIKEILNDHRFLFEYGNEEELAKKIKIIFENTKLKEKMSIKAGEVIKKYSREEMIKRYKEVYREILNEDT